ncbi:hypothetical protein IMPERIA75_420008 [Imperialibacter sp. 75]|nr:hypothetical protein IMPERIA75_420008 [Imperialibacter sp. 75]
MGFKWWNIPNFEAESSLSEAFSQQSGEILCEQQESTETESVTRFHFKNKGLQGCRRFLRFTAEWL